MEPNKCVYELEASITYSKKGEFEECYSIELDAPTYKNLKASLKIAQLVAAMNREVLKNVQDAGVETPTEKPEQKDGVETPTEKPEQKDGEVLISAAMISQMVLNSSIDLEELISAFESMVVTGMAKLDESGTPMKKTHLESMTANDVFGMLCKYIEVFTIPSILQGV